VIGRKAGIGNLDNTNILRAIDNHTKSAPQSELVFCRFNTKISAILTLNTTVKNSFACVIANNKNLILWQKLCVITSKCALEDLRKFNQRNTLIVRDTARSTPLFENALNSYNTIGVCTCGGNFKDTCCLINRKQRSTSANNSANITSVIESFC